MPYRETIRGVGNGEGVDPTMFSGFWNRFPLVVFLFLAVAGIFLFVIPTPRLRRWMVWWKLVLLALGLVAAGLIWGRRTVPMVWNDAFKLPNWLEKLTIVESLVVVAFLCISARQRLVAYLPPVGTRKPLDAFSCWWTFTGNPGSNGSSHGRWTPLREMLGETARDQSFIL